MPFAILHLSDIHFKPQGNPIVPRLDLLVNSVRARILEHDQLMIITSGDVAYSGRASEYALAKSFFEDLISKLPPRFAQNSSAYFVPGNHDCDFTAKGAIARKSTAKDIEGWYSSMPTEIIETLTIVQDAFFNFQASFDTNPAVYSDHVLTKRSIRIGSKNICLYLINSALLSQNPETQGNLIFPVEYYGEKFREDCHLAVGVFHHGLNWFQPENARKFKELLMRSCDLILTGHEHTSDAALVKTTSEQSFFIEGGVLQDSKAENQFSFNLLSLNLDNNTYSVYQYDLKDKNPSETPIFSNMQFHRSITANKGFAQVNSEFDSLLRSPGATFTHPRIEKLTIDDIYVYPNLLEYVKEENRQKQRLHKGINAKTIINSELPIKFLISGQNQSGKSMLCRKFYLDSLARGLTPVLLDGRRIKRITPTEIEKFVDQNISEQYSPELSAEFKQLPSSKRVIIIDDFDNISLSAKLRIEMIGTLNEMYENIILSVSDLFKYEEFVIQERTDLDVLKSYRSFDILECNFTLRRLLIEKWNNLGSSYDPDDEATLRMHDQSERVLDTVIGKNLLPVYPIFILTILQSIEAGKTNTLEQSSYGYYYNYLIIKTLGELKRQPDDMNALDSYIESLAYKFYVENITEISQANLQLFHTDFCDRRSLTHDFTRFFDDLLKGKILEIRRGNAKFKYDYLYYYYVGKYLANHITEETIMAQIVALTKKIYVDKNANIIMFLTYHSKDPRIITQLLENAKEIFKQFSPIQFNEDIAKFNDLLSDLPKLVYQDQSVKDARESDLAQRDKNYNQAGKPSDPASVGDMIDESQNELSIIAQLNLATKSIEIIGQVLRNYYGHLGKEIKIDLMQEAYFVGLRTIRMFFNVIETDKESVVEFIHRLLKDDGVIKEDGPGADKKAETAARRILFNMACNFSYTFIKRISYSVGSEKLLLTFEEIKKKHSQASIDLIDASIKLDHFKGFPLQELKALKNKLDKKYIPDAILQRLVIDYLYMFPVPQDEKQQICDSFGIDIQTTRKFDSGRPVKRIR